MAAAWVKRKEPGRPDTGSELPRAGAHERQLDLSAKAAGLPIDETDAV